MQKGSTGNGGNMNNVSKTIGWAEKTWNPIVGCNNGCKYCYARKIAMRFVGDFKPTFHAKRLKEPKLIKKPSRIFADSMSDFWSDGVKQIWRNKIYDAMKESEHHTFFVLTKKPQKITKEDIKRIPKNMWLGVSIARFTDRWRLTSLVSRYSGKTFVSVEPILDDIISEYVYIADWIILGGLTGVKNPFRPKKETIEDIIRTCKKLNKPLFIKENLDWKNKVQEFPK